MKTSGTTVVCFNTNGQLANPNKHNEGKGDEEMQPKPTSSSDQAPPVTRLGDGGVGNKVEIQGVAATALSPSSTTPPPSKKRFVTAAPTTSTTSQAKEKASPNGRNEKSEPRFEKRQR